MNAAAILPRVSGWSDSSRNEKHYKNTSKRATREAPFACFVFCVFLGWDYKRKTRPVDLCGGIGKGHAHIKIKSLSQKIVKLKSLLKFFRNFETDN